MKNKFKIIEFLKEVPVDQLSRHPDAMLPMDDQDKEAIRQSMEEDGLIQPLLVVASKNIKDSYQIIDGCNRFEQAKDDRATFPCLLTKTDDVRNIALSTMSARRKCTTGQRIMAYIEGHKKEVLEAVEIIAKKQETRKNTNKLPLHNVVQGGYIEHDIAGESLTR